MFSPKLLGGKIISNFFVVEDSEMDDDTAAVLHNAFTLRFVSHILLVVGTFIGLVMTGVAYYLGKLREAKLLASRATMTPEVAVALGHSMGNKADSFDYRDDDEL